MEPITVLIADDHAVVRKGLQYMLETSPRIRVVAEASTGMEAVEAVRVDRPMVVLMDLMMPDMDGLEATRQIKERSPETRVVVMTVQEDAEWVAEALQAGANGYLLKNARCEEICQAVETAARGEVAIKATLLEGALRVMGNRPGTSRPPHGPAASIPGVEDLTERETLVLQLLAEGKTNKEIGAELYISAGTVKKHVESVLGKLRVDHRSAAAAMAIRMGLVR